MDGAFLDLEAEAIEGEVDEYWREIYKIQKVFNVKVKKMQIEIDEINRERKKKRRMAEEDGHEGAEIEPDEVLHTPAAVNVCSSVQDNMTEFKVLHLLLAFLHTIFTLSVQTPYHFCLRFALPASGHVVMGLQVYQCPFKYMYIYVPRHLWEEGHIDLGANSVGVGNSMKDDT